MKKGLMRHRHKTLLTGFVVLILILIITQLNTILILDRYAAQIFYNILGNTKVTSFFRIITDYTLGSVLFGPLITFGFILYKRSYKVIPFLGVSYVLLIILRFVLQVLFVRNRPFLVFIDHPYLGPILPLGYSFPSFHAMSAFFLAYFITTFFRLDHVRMFLVYALAFLVGISRVYLGAHFPLDVVGGGMIGLLYGYLSYHLYNPRRNHSN